MRRHRVAEGEDVFMLAELYYGDWTLWELIYEANREVIGDDPEALTPGTEIVIPDLPQGETVEVEDDVRLMEEVRRYFGSYVFYWKVLKENGIPDDPTPKGQIHLPKLGNRKRLKKAERLRWRYLSRR